MAAMFLVKPTLSFVSPHHLNKPIHSHKSSYFMMTAITCGPRSNRGPLQKGRTISTEAILAVQALKRAARVSETKVEDVISGTVLRLTKPDLLAALAELQRQDLCKLALRVFVTARNEFWCDTDYGLYANMVAALSRNGMIEEMNSLVEDLLGKGEIGPGVDTRGLAKLLKSLIAVRKGAAVAMMYRAIKTGGCVVDGYLARVMRDGLRKLGEIETAEEVERDYAAFLSVNAGRVDSIRRYASS